MLFMKQYIEDNDNNNEAVLRHALPCSRAWTSWWSE